MSTQGFKFDSSQQYQLDAIAAAVDLFDGQPQDAEQLVSTLRGTSVNLSPEEVEAAGAIDMDLSQEVGAIGNNLLVSSDLILSNLQGVQDRLGLEVSPKLFDEQKLDFDVEMETGTGKTYVYLRTMFELAKRYNFRKFIILVPSVAIREGVATSIRLMKSHFRDLYPDLPFDSSVYSGKNAEEVQSFATATTVQILIMTIASIRESAPAAKAGDEEAGDGEGRLIINRRRDKLNGFRPIDYLQATRPILIMDEPQNMESGQSADAVDRLRPAFTLRYSATHKTQRNVIYRLDPVDAHDLGLVKQIVVAEVQQQGADATPYLKLIQVRNKSGWEARLELSVRTASGALERKEVSVKPNIELSSDRITNNPVYDGWRVNAMSSAMDGQSGFIELTLHGQVEEGQTIGGATGAIYKEMIRETIREHFRKQKMLEKKNIKVLSLFFVDKVASYMGEGTTNLDADGEFAQWFDETYAEERNKSEDYVRLFPAEPSDVRKAYFSQIKRAGKVVIQDSSGTTKADDDAYELIMQDKERLLDDAEPVRFIFSHSALREGWDNPNVFQICTLREMGSETERRQTLGRGLRLPVAKTDQGFERVPDRSIATLTVVANETYQSFAKSLQTEYQKAGIEIGHVRLNEFAKILVRDADGVATEKPFGYEKSVEVWNHLDQQGFIKDGKVTSKFQPATVGFDLSLPGPLAPYQDEIIELIGGANIERYVKAKSQRAPRALNKAVLLTPEFEELWEAISGRTTYRVEFKSTDVVSNAVQSIKAAPPIQPLRIQVTKAGIKVRRGGAKGQELGVSATELKGTYDLPDIVSELQDATSLTRSTIIDVLTQSDRLAEFIHNPNDFIAMAKHSLLSVLAETVVAGIQYEKIAGSVYEMRELRQDGEEEKERFLDQMYKVQNTDKADFDYVVFDSEVERDFAEFLDNREDVKFFMKLPAKFKIPTPVGDYNPDWAIIKLVDDQEKVYLIRETKGTTDLAKLRPSERAKIESAMKHFEALGDIDYAVTAPPAWAI
jgi:type III restriction enzyme